jgi:hypothetical protein
VYGVKITSANRKKKGMDSYHLEHQHAFDKQTYQPIGTAKPPVEEKKEDVPELTAEDFDEIDEFMNTL